jgi:hypothetical protein
MSPPRTTNARSRTFCLRCPASTYVLLHELPGLRCAPPIPPRVAFVVLHCFAALLLWLCTLQLAAGRRLSLGQIAVKVLDLFSESRSGTRAPKPEVTAPLLLSVVGPSVPDIKPILAFFHSAFDAKRAKEEGNIIPKPVGGVTTTMRRRGGVLGGGRAPPSFRCAVWHGRPECAVYWLRCKPFGSPWYLQGVDRAYDSALAEVTQLERDLEAQLSVGPLRLWWSADLSPQSLCSPAPCPATAASFFVRRQQGCHRSIGALVGAPAGRAALAADCLLPIAASQEHKDALKCRDIVYFHSRTNVRDRYQLEVPESAASRMPSKYALKSQRKGFRRYSTAQLDEMIDELCRVRASFPVPRCMWRVFFPLAK